MKAKPNLAATATLALFCLACPVRTDGTDAGTPQYDGGADGGSSGGLTIADCQNPTSPNYPGADAMVNLVERVVTSPLFSVTTALDGFFVSDPGGGPYSGVLVTVATGLVTVNLNDLVDIEARITEFQGDDGNSGTETQLAATRVTGAGPAPAPATPTVVDPGVFANESAVEPYEGVLVKVENVQIVLFPDGSLTTYGQFQISGGALVDDELFEYAPGSQEIFNSITGVVRYTYYGDYVIVPRTEADIDSQSGARTVTDATIAQVQNYDDPNHPEVCATTLERCNPVRLTNVVVVAPITCEDREDDCHADEEDYGSCPCYIYGTFVVDPAAIDGSGRLTAWSGIKLTGTPGQRWRRGTECDGLSGQAFVDCGSAGSLNQDINTNYTFAGHFQKDAVSQDTSNGFPQVGDVVTLIGEPAEYFEMTQIGRLEELTKVGNTSDPSPPAQMPLPALFDGDVEAIYSGMPAVPEIARPALPPGADTEKFEGTLVELTNVQTLDACVEYPYGGDASQMTDFGYFRVAGSGASPLHGVEIGSGYLDLWDSWGGWWRSPSSGGPAYSDRTCTNTSSVAGAANGLKCDDYRRSAQAFSSIIGVIEYSYDVHRLEPTSRDKIVCATDCDMNTEPGFCPQ